MRPHCSICQEYHRIDLFRFLSCGHGFCITSLERYAPSHTRKPCPICRAPFRLQDAHSVYIETVDPNAPHSQSSLDEQNSVLRYPSTVLKQAGFASEKIRHMDSRSSSETVQRAGREIQKVVDGVDGQPGNLEALLSAIADFLKRIGPVFSTVSDQTKELASLRKDLRVAETENLAISKEARKANKLANDAVETADKARHEIFSLREENYTLQKRLEQRTEEHKEENKGLWNTILAHKEKETKQKSKIEALRRLLEEHELTISRLSRSVAQTPVASRTAHLQLPQRPIPVRNVLHGSPCQTDNETTFDSDSELAFADPEPLKALPALLPTPSFSLHEPAAPQRPKFGTDWNLKPLQHSAKRKRVVSEQGLIFKEKAFPIKLDDRGRPQGVVQLGSRQRTKLG